MWSNTSPDRQFGLLAGPIADAFGTIITPHILGQTPSVALATPFGGAGGSVYITFVSAVSASNFSCRCFLLSGAAVAAAVVVNIYYYLEL